MLAFVGVFALPIIILWVPCNAPQNNNMLGTINV